MIVQGERLWVADPKAAHHILQGSGYLYQKPYVVNERLATLMDWGLVSVEGGFIFIFRVACTNSSFDFRRHTQTTEESHGPRFWSR